MDAQSMAEADLAKRFKAIEESLLKINSNIENMNLQMTQSSESNSIHRPQAMQNSKTNQVSSSSLQHFQRLITDQNKEIEDLKLQHIAKDEQHALQKAILFQNQQKIKQLTSQNASLALKNKQLQSEMTSQQSALAQSCEKDQVIIQKDKEIQRLKEQIKTNKTQRESSQKMISKIKESIEQYLKLSSKFTQSEIANSPKESSLSEEKLAFYISTMLNELKLRKQEESHLRKLSKIEQFSNIEEESDYQDYSRFAVADNKHKFPAFLLVAKMSTIIKTTENKLLMKQQELIKKQQELIKKQQELLCQKKQLANISSSMLKLEEDVEAVSSKTIVSHLVCDEKMEKNAISHQIQSITANVNKFVDQIINAAKIMREIQSNNEQMKTKYDQEILEKTEQIQTLMTNVENLEGQLQKKRAQNETLNLKILEQKAALKKQEQQLTIMKDKQSSSRTKIDELFAKATENESALKKMKKQVSDFQIEISEQLSSVNNEKILLTVSNYKTNLPIAVLSIKKQMNKALFLTQSVLYRALLPEHRQFVEKCISETVTNRKISKTKTLLEADNCISAPDWLNKLRNRPNILMLVRLSNSYLIGGFSQQPLTNEPYPQGRGFIMSITNKKKYSLKSKPNACVLMPDKYFFIFGYHDITVQPKGTITSAGFGNNSSSFNSSGDTVVHLMGEQSKNWTFDCIQFHEIFFE